MQELGAPLELGAVDLQAPLLQQIPEVGEAEAQIANVGGWGADEIAAAEIRGIDMGLGAEEILGLQLGLAGELGKGGLLSWGSSTPTLDSYTKRYTAEHVNDGYWQRRDDRQTRLEQNWIDQDVYVNVGNFWYLGKVNSAYLATKGDPMSRFNVTIGWDDPNGKTQDVTIPAT